MLKTIFFAILKIAGGLIGIVILILGLMIYNSFGGLGYRTGLFGVKYFYKQNYDSWFYSKTNLEGEHRSSFEVFEKNGIYAKDKNRVYYKGHALLESDPSSFSVDLLFTDPLSLRQGALCRDKRNVYYQTDLVSQDAENFIQYSDPHIFKDSENVYRLTPVVKPKYTQENHFVKIEGAKPGTFESVSGFQSVYRDDQHVFYKNHLVKEASINNLRKIEAFWTDEQNVFFNEHILKGAEVSSFQALEYPYARDVNKLYYENLLMEGVSPNELKEMKANRSYAYVGAQVFFEGKPLINAELASLEQIYFHFWKDRSRVFYENVELPGADPNTFELLETSRKRISDFGKDAQSVFYKGRKLEGVNPATFEKKGKDPWRNDKWTDGIHRFNHLGERL